MSCKKSLASMPRAISRQIGVQGERVGFCEIPWLFRRHMERSEEAIDHGHLTCSSEIRVLHLVVECTT